MTKQFHYNYSDAMDAAKAFAAENDGYVSNEISADEKTLQGCSYMDEEADKLTWSGEVSAITVMDKNYDLIGLFAYWKKMIANSQVLDAFRVLKAYAEQVKDQRATLYFDALKAGNQDFANQHLKRIQAASNIEAYVPYMEQFYRDSK